jgi:hypothetical protein
MQVPPPVRRACRNSGIPCGSQSEGRVEPCGGSRRGREVWLSRLLPVDEMMRKQASAALFG